MADIQTTSCKFKRKLNVLELYCGIGGMHYALTKSGNKFDIKLAVDINNVTNKIYEHNYPDIPLLRKSIESLTLKQLNALEIDLIVMSPPCQPFTRVGKQKDSEDPRTSSFFRVLKFIDELDKKPSYILLENVKGFDHSKTRDVLTETLERNDYEFQEFLLTPLQIGIPNSRLRYYLIAKRKPERLCFETTTEIMTSIPDTSEHQCETTRNLTPSVANMKIASSHMESHYPTNEKAAARSHDIANCKKCSLTDEDSSIRSHDAKTTTDSPLTNEDSCFESHDGNACKHNSKERTTSFDNKSEISEETKINCDNKSNETGDVKLHEKYKELCQPISNFLENQPKEYFHNFAFPKESYKKFWVMDIVQPDLRNTCCFTKGYGRHLEGAGSLLQMAKGSCEKEIIKEDKTYTDESHSSIEALQLRFFTPREIASLLCFPDSFSFPDDTTNLQRYRSLGNSLNVHVVSELLRILLL